ncbi:hydroxyacid dehydrogenase [Arthrobacter sp. SLBN-122]|uniref:hydroxyacid dehydrogenase n=1 Tax=Arthrobacter sp. SLBN-122 TaxID=2768455 RepID=UPI00116C6D49|nr:hydroxyacid dehydrogenase [Arthrobacter sp. SLBN-122]TQJ34679.1 phosphoglycerate dehydrogenase-like enzyme [Arthrobacter sp. SLBN-122]
MSAALHSTTAPKTPRFRPKVALAMQDADLRDALFSKRLRSRLESICDCDFSMVIQDFKATPDEALGDVDVLLTGWFSPRIDATVLARMPRLRLIAHAGGSVKGHVLPECWERGITVTTAAEANALPVAEYTLGLILLAGKSTIAASHLYTQRQTKIDRELEFPDSGNYERSIGIVGASTIGRLVLERLRPFDFDVSVYDPTISDAEALRLGARRLGLHELMSCSDIVSLHAPVLSETVNMVGPAQLAAMKDGSTLINTARGELVDHNALIAELEAGRLNAFLDVTSPEPLPAGHPLYSLPNVLLTPHIAGSMGTELHRLAAYAIEEIERYAAAEPQRFPVGLTDLVRMA